MTAAPLLDARVRATFVQEGGERPRVWLEIAAPVEAYPVNLHENLMARGWVVPSSAIVVPVPAAANEEEYDSGTGMVLSWERRRLGFDEVQVAYCPVDGDGASIPATAEQVGEARAALRYSGITRAPVLRRSWRHLV